MAAAGGVTIDWLATGRPPRTRAEQRAAQTQAQCQEPAAPDEAAIIATYRATTPPGRAALDQLAAALRAPSMSAWLAAGQAINAAASLSDKPE